ncbi:MAG: archaetidylserine decarboxylase [Gammaproteobacteria bacterium]|nr:archaetidylserine decarboxylase [Gammaproteobacteria bacterium]
MEPVAATSWEKFKGLIFHCFPHHLLSRTTFWLTRQHLPYMEKLISFFISAFKVDMKDAVIEDISRYSTFNEFFTRELKPNTRPIDSSTESIASPCDGKISMFGEIDQNTLIQAKNKTFTLNEFLTPSCENLDKFIGGSFCTIYLSPRDYHRVHAAYSGQLLEMIYVPGRLFSVAPYAPKAIDKLYARNERVVSVFKIENGYMAITMVGAVNVSAIEMIWEGLVTPPHLNTTVHYNYTDRNIVLNKGQHMGTFNMGSTVVMIFSKSYAQMLQQLHIDQTVRMGETIATRMR